MTVSAWMDETATPTQQQRGIVHCEWQPWEKTRHTNSLERVCATSCSKSGGIAAATSCACAGDSVVATNAVVVPAAIPAGDTAGNTGKPSSSVGSGITDFALLANGSGLFMEATTLNKEESQATHETSADTERIVCDVRRSPLTCHAVQQGQSASAASQLASACDPGALGPPAALLCSGIGTCSEVG